MNVAKSCFRICETNLATPVASSIEDMKLGSVGQHGKSVISTVWGKGQKTVGVEGKIHFSGRVSRHKSVV